MCWGWAEQSNQCAPPESVEPEGEAQRLREMDALDTAADDTLRQLGADGREGQRVNVHGPESVP